MCQIGADTGRAESHFASRGTRSRSRQRPLKRGFHDRLADTGSLEQFTTPAIPLLANTRCGFRRWLETRSDVEAVLRWRAAGGSLAFLRAVHFRRERLSRMAVDVVTEIEIARP